MTKTIEMDSGRVFHHVSQEGRTCETHGDYEAYEFELRPSTAPDWLRKHWTNCPTCDAAWQIEADEKHREATDGLTEKEVWRRRKLEETGIPERFRESTLWNWEHAMDKQDQFHRWAKVFAHDFANDKTGGRSVVFHGPPGTGKTHLAVGLLQEAIKSGDGRYTTIMDMLGRIKDTYNPKAHETEEEVVYEYSAVGLLVIDELGKSLDTNYEASQFFRVIDKRYRSGLSTVLISNKGKAGTIEFLGEAVMDRLRENGGKMLGFEWDSYRRRRAQKEVE